MPGVLASPRLRCLLACSLRLAHSCHGSEGPWRQPARFGFFAQNGRPDRRCEDRAGASLTSADRRGFSTATAAGRRPAIRQPALRVGLLRRQHLSWRGLHHRRQFRCIERYHLTLVRYRAIGSRSFAPATVPIEPISRSIASGGNSCPCWVPAAREILSFISVPPMSLAPAFRHIAAPSGPIFTQEVWMLVISGCRTSPRHRVHQHCFTQGRPFPCEAAQVHRRFHMHERQRHEFGKAASLCLQITQYQKMTRPVQRPLCMAIHDGGGGAQPPGHAPPARHRSIAGY